MLINYSSLDITKDVYKCIMFTQSKCTTQNYIC